MCNEYTRRMSYRDYVELLRQVSLPLVSPPPDKAPNLEPQASVRPTDRAPIFRRQNDGVELAMARWWFIPWWHRGKQKDWKRTTFNARSETVATSPTFRDAFAEKRCLVPADSWFEFTGEKRSKVRWIVRPRNESGICFAGIWERCATSDEGVVESFTILMRDPEPPLDALHNRQPVVLRPEDWATWLDVRADVQPLFRIPNGDRFAIERAA